MPTLLEKLEQAKSRVKDEKRILPSKKKESKKNEPMFKVKNSPPVFYNMLNE